MIEKEKPALLEFLSAMLLPDLLSLASTVTMGKINPQNAIDAVECIMLHSDDVESILKRKKITKEYLFNYLHWKKVEISGTADKSVLIKKVIELWAEQPPYSKELAKMENRLSCGGDLNSCGRELNSYGGELNSCGAELNSYGGELNSCGGELNSYASQTNSMCSSSSMGASTCLNNEQIQLMAFEFSKWFFGLLNDVEPSTGNCMLVAEHFWNDAISRVTISSQGQVIEDEETADSTSGIELFSRLKTVHRLYFSPNLTTDGIRAKSDPHGGVLVLVCGSLHQGAGNMVGVFEQMFVLYQDPMRNNAWKIHRTEMRLKSSISQQRMPIAEEGELITKFDLDQHNDTQIEPIVEQSEQLH